MKLAEVSAPRKVKRNGEFLRGWAAHPCFLRTEARSDSDKQEDDEALEPRGKKDVQGRKLL